MTTLKEKKKAKTTKKTKN